VFGEMLVKSSRNYAFDGSDAEGLSRVDR
jgi:hypothetical protein